MWRLSCAQRKLRGRRARDRSRPARRRRRRAARPTRSGRRRPGRCGPAGARRATPPARARSGFPNRTSRGIRSTIGGDCIQAPSSAGAYTPAHGSAPDRDVRLGGRRADGAARVPGHASRTRTSSTSATPRPTGSRTGPSPPATIRRFAHEIATHLAELDTKLVVVACNAATSAALPELQREFAVPLIGVITPEARAAVQVTRNRRVGVMATQATVDERPLPGGGARAGRRHRGDPGGLPRARAADPERRHARPRAARGRQDVRRAAQARRAPTPSSSAAPTTR